MRSLRGTGGARPPQHCRFLPLYLLAIIITRVRSRLVLRLYPTLSVELGCLIIIIKAVIDFSISFVDIDRGLPDLVEVRGHGSWRR